MTYPVRGGEVERVCHATQPRQCVANLGRAKRLERLVERLARDGGAHDERTSVRDAGIDDRDEGRMFGRRPDESTKRVGDITRTIGRHIDIKGAAV